ncbi:zinc-dependent metalloprotease [Haloarchaeobius sp. TZWWS8]|uniref:zinc-dependent metalloprotease n=1 Tax=Haloarchaeobius sp. TZWWS8 TaxID=3446121 RepID=UPI003EBB3810
MSLFRSVRAVASSSGGDGAIDWHSVAEAAKGATDPGSIDLSEADQQGYATDVRDARDRVSEVAGIDFDVPRTIEIQHRHHWIDANIETFRRVLKPLEEQQLSSFPGVARTVNTGTMSFMLGFLARNVLGQYDPLLLAGEDVDADHALYFVHPNIERVATVLDVDFPRFRRWIAFHEVTHAAEFGAAPWLSTYLEDRMEEGLSDLSHGSFDRKAFKEMNAAMTVVEGYAELLMDHAFDGEYADLRRKVDARRRGQGPLTKLIKRLLGLGLKRQQYERGKAFFEFVAAERGIRAAGVVWERPENLPTEEELDAPGKWIRRVDP